MLGIDSGCWQKWFGGLCKLQDGLSSEPLTDIRQNWLCICQAAEMGFQTEIGGTNYRNSNKTQPLRTCMPENV